MRHFPEKQKVEDRVSVSKKDTEKKKKKLKPLGREGQFDLTEDKTVHSATHAHKQRSRIGLNRRVCTHDSEETLKTRNTTKKETQRGESGLKK